MFPKGHAMFLKLPHYAWYLVGIKSVTLAVSIVCYQKLSFN